MSFSELLSLTAGGTVFIFAFMEGRKAGGSLGISVGLILGLAMGLGVFLGTRIILKQLIQRLNLHEPNLPLLRLALSWFICVAVFVGMAAVGIFASWLTRFVIRLMQ